MSDTINREDILGEAAKSFSFDKALRGYDTKQVDDYINSLIKSNKNAIEIINSRISEMKTDNDMLKYELEQAHNELDDALQANATLRSEMQKMTAENTKANAAAAAAAVAANKTANNEEIKELEEKIKKLTTRNRLLSDENKKLEDEKKDMQRDIAHLTKKVDKNRNKITELTSQLEIGGGSDEGYYEITQIYESAIDKAEDLIFRLQNEFSLAHSKAEDAKNAAEERKAENAKKAEELKKAAAEETEE